MSQKAKSHQLRITSWLRDYKAVPETRTNDFFTAKIGFNTLMDISGSFRKQCLLSAGNVIEYIRKRHEQGPAGVDIAEQVAFELATNRDEIDSLDPEVRIDYIVARTLDTVTANMQLQRFLHQWAAENRKPGGQPLAEPDSEPIAAMLKSQKLLIELEVAQMAVAASFRDNNPAKIPFLHPVNISDNPGVIYPFAA